MRVPYLMQRTTLRRAKVIGCLSIACLLLVACQSSNDDDTPPLDDQPVELSAAQRATLPDDCLFTLDAMKVAYCFSPQDRNLMAVLLDGSTYWRNPLPGDDVEALFAVAVPEPVELVEPDCVYEYPETPNQCSGELQQGPFSWDCPVSGSVTLNQQATVSFVGGIGRSTSIAYQYGFHDCELDVAANDSLADGRYRFTGFFETNLANLSIPQGSQNLGFYAFVEAELTYPDGLVRATGEGRDSGRGTSFGLIEKDVVLTDFESTRPSDTFAIKDLSFHDESENHSEPKQKVTLGGNLSLSSPATSNQIISLRIDPPLSNLYWGTDTATLSGVVRLETESGDGLTITALENPAFPDDEQLQFQYDGDSEPAITRPFECLMIPCF